MDDITATPAAVACKTQGTELKQALLYPKHKKASNAGFFVS